MPEQTAFPAKYSGVVCSILEDTYERQEELEQAIKSLKRFRKIISELEKYVAKDWPFHVLHLLDKHYEFIKDQCLSRSFPFQELENLRVGAKGRVEKFRVWYPNRLEKACQEAGLPMDMTSRFPVYTFEKGFFELTVDRKGLALLSNSEAKLAEFPADIGAVVQKVGEEHERIFARPLDGRYFLKKLRNHYLGVVQRLKLEDGASVPIRRIAGRMASEKKGYQVDQFIVDLSRLAQKGPLEIDSKRLELQHTRDDQAGMLLHDIGTVAYVGFIRFEEVNA